MTKDEDFKLLKIQTCVLRVNIHCDGCKQKVKKLLQRIEGVYQVNIDAEQQKVTVLGGVDAATLIKRLVRAGKHAELWSQKSGAQNQKHKANCIKDDKSNKGQKQGLMKGLEALKNQQKFPFNLQEDEDFPDDDEEEDEEDEELRYVREKANHIHMLRQQAAAIEGNNAKKGFEAIAAAAAAAAPNNGKMNNNNNCGNANTGKKGNPNQNMGIKGNPGGIDQKTMAALKMNNAQLSGANINPGEVKMGSDISSMMNLTGFHGNGTNNLAAVLGGNPNIAGNFHQHQVQAANNGFMGSPSAGFPTAMASGNHHPSSMMVNMNGYQQQLQLQQQQQQLMNLQNRHAMQQPQMMYNRSPFIPSSTGYYYNYGPIPYTTTYTADHHYHSGGAGGGDHSSTDMFSDDNTSSCSIM